MSKNKLLFLILLSVSLLFLGSCAKKETGSLTFMVGGAPSEVEYWSDLIGEFEKDSGIKVRIIRQPTDSDQRRQGLVIPLEAGQSEPDVFLMDVIWIGQFAASDWLEPLDPYLTREGFSIEPFFKKIVDYADRYNKKLVALPVYVDGGLLYYRKDLLKKYGYALPPRTWKELLDYSLKIQEGERKENPDFYGFVWQGAQYEGLTCNFLEFAASNGGGIVDLNGRLKIDSPENIEALEFMSDLINKHKISPPNTYTEMREEQVRSFFQRGNALFERNWPYAWKLHEQEDSEVKGKVGIAPLPHFAGGKSVSALGGWHVGISRYSDVKDDAWRLVEFICSYGTQKKLVLALGWNPGRKDVYEDKEVRAQLPHLGVLENIFINAVARPNLPYYTQVSDALQRYVNASLSDTVKPSRSLYRAQQEAQRISETYNK
ncbi:ABC transporter substrate-binding protein [Candidatus Margulisiibacteriota bacterium]